MRISMSTIVSTRYPDRQPSQTPADEPEVPEPAGHCLATRLRRWDSLLLRLLRPALRELAYAFEAGPQLDIG